MNVIIVHGIGWLSSTEKNYGNHSLMKTLHHIELNRPFYRYGGHIELIRFKEYYRMPRGHEHILFVFSSAFRDIFS